MTKTSLTVPQITHDLRNYIGGIFGLANIISENIAAYKAKQEASGFKLDDNLKEISECANMLAPYSDEALHYVEDILYSTQIETRKFTLGKIEECDLEELIKRLLIFNKTFFINQKVIVETEIEENLPKLKTDIFRLKQILTNLITNAVKYSNAGSKVRIVVKNINCQIQIEIIDSGIGMTPEEIKMALNGNGKNIDKSGLNKSIDSHGLGMPIVKQLIELLGDKMEIKSEKGVGTTILLTFISL